MSPRGCQVLGFARGVEEQVWYCRGSMWRAGRIRFHWGKCCVLVWEGLSGRIVRRGLSHSLEVRLVRVDLMGNRANSMVGNHRCSWLIDEMTRVRHAQLRLRDRALVP